MAPGQNPRTYNGNIEKRKFKKFEGEVRLQSPILLGLLTKRTKTKHIWDPNNEMLWKSRPKLHLAASDRQYFFVQQESLNLGK